ncbi:iron-containing alcohol dehydrogenase [Peribacillus muralis]|uniref:iron-containing alcohol dehydrogenase n=1 Tax=Peribacillus muralis TaxID=264697 RepID=UPI001F4D5403|nr:iron-containing alcohol dehydrogenase [Peribacillus muralis]MCK1992257.1 iron-containing alcohol dehydrogenase [Peribacillus muralis]MCK2012813.1 iron-containing alcohol dehydrogenase [Peribacillus muralis]
MFAHINHDFRMPTVFRFGVGAFATLAKEIETIGAKKVAIVSDKGLEKVGVVQRVVELIEPLSVPTVTYTNIAGEPTFQLLRDAVETLQAEKCDLIIGIGGGSALDVAKATAALCGKDDISSYLSGAKTIESRSVKCILLPTTSGTGSEVTLNAIFGDEEQQVKRGLVSPAFLPDAAIIDPELTISCPPRVTAASGVDAFTHAIESYIAIKSTPLTKVYSEKAMKLFTSNITKAVHNGNDLEARIGMSWVSSLAGVALANAGVGAVHALAYPLGGTFHIEHGVANALLMPFVFEVIGKTCTEEMIEVASFLQLGDYKSRPHQALKAVVAYMYQLLEDLDLPTSLSELGIDEGSLPMLAEQAAKIDRLLSNTPYKLNEQKILGIYQSAFNGREGN